MVSHGIVYARLEISRFGDLVVSLNLLMAHCPKERIDANTLVVVILILEQ